MVVKVAATCLQWSLQSTPMPPHVPSSSSSSQTLVSSSSSPCTAVISHYTTHNRRHSSSFFVSVTPKLHRAQSCPFPNSKFQIIAGASSYKNFNDFSSPPLFSDEEFSKKMEESALKFQFSNDYKKTEEFGVSSSPIEPFLQFQMVQQHQLPSSEPEDEQEDEEWGELIASNIERKANSVDLPFSLRILKRKLQEGGIEAKETAYCSIRKAFSSMVFIIRELNSYTLQMRQYPYSYDDLQGILERVQKEMHASFVWLFQQVFSHTPTLMVSVMILMANFTVYSMSSNSAIAITMVDELPPPSSVSITSASPLAITPVEKSEVAIQKFDSATLKSFPSTVISDNSVDGGKIASIGGNDGGGNSRSVASGIEDEGWFKDNRGYGRLDERESLAATAVAAATEEGKVIKEIREIEEMKLWDVVVDEAERLQALTRDESLDTETCLNFVSPITAKIDGSADNDDYQSYYENYFRTEVVYRTLLAQEPSNTLLLANFAQFLYLVARDYDRAQELFKRAIKMEPKDAEAYNKYANFLWLARDDTWSAEEVFLQAIEIEPTNPFYPANYAHFLWNTGGEDTCFPLDDTPEDHIS